MKITTTRDKELTSISALLHGDSGIGKTTSLGTLPEDKTLLIIGERGSVPLREKNYTVIRVDNWQDVRDAYAAIRSPDSVEDEELKKAIKSARVIGIDSLSEISEMCMKHIVTVDRKHLVKQRTKDKRDTPEGIYEDQMTQEDWGLYRTRMKNIVSAFCHLPMNVICTVLSAWTEDKQTGRQLRTPNFSGKFAHECPAYFDLVLHMEAPEAQEEGAPTRVWRTFNDGKIMAKDASGVLDAFESPNWSDVFRKIIGNGSTTKGK